MPDDSDDGALFWLWVLVALSSAGYAAVSVLGAPPAGDGLGGLVRVLVQVGLPVAMCGGATWLAVEAWRARSEA
jgi:hypothetical protein